MADVKTTDESAAAALTGAELIRGVQSAANVYLTVAQIATYIASVMGFTAFNFDIELGSTADSDPGAGLLKFNNATPSSATVLYIDDSTSDGVSLATYYAGLASTGYIHIVSDSDPGEWLVFKYTSITDGSGYRKFNGTVQASKGSFEDADPVNVNFIASGGGAGTTTGKHSIPVTAGAMVPSVTSGCAALSQIASASGQPDILTLNFDPTTEEYAQFSIPMPKKWDEGTITAKFIWSHASTTTNFGVVWGIQAVAMGDDDTILANWGTAVTVADTGGTTSDIYVTSETSAFTVAGTPQAEDLVFFRVYRAPANGSDTMAIDARLHAVVLYITTSADTDA